MARRGGARRRWGILRYIVSSVVVARAPALTVREQDQAEGDSGAAGFFTVGEFQFCSAPAAGHGVPATSTCGRDSDNPYFDFPSETAVMTSLVHGMHWLLGRTTQEWLPACFLTTHYSMRPSLTCQCLPHLGPLSLQSAFWGLWVLTWSYQVESLVFFMYLYRDIYKRSAVLDSILVNQVRNKNFDQVVMLGSGFDTRAYRYGAGMRKVRKVFYTDLQDVLDIKAGLLDKCEIEPLQGPSQVTNLPMSLIEERPFEGLWQHEDFVTNGTTLLVSEQAFAGLTLAANVRWLQQLRRRVLASGGRATLVLMATSGPNFNMSRFPQCVSKGECLKAQMPKDPKEAEAFMRRLGWRKDKSRPDLELPYVGRRISPLSTGYVGVFETVSSDSLAV